MALSPHSLLHFMGLPLPHSLLSQTPTTPLPQTESGRVQCPAVPAAHPAVPPGAGGCGAVPGQRWGRSQPAPSRPRQLPAVPRALSSRRLPRVGAGSPRARQLCLKGRSALCSPVFNVNVYRLILAVSEGRGSYKRSELTHLPPCAPNQPVCR